MKNSSTIILLLVLTLVACNSTSFQQKEKELNNTKTITNSKTECSCYNGIGSSEQDEPILVSKFSNGSSVSLCGYYDDEIQVEGLIMSEFNVFNCETGEALVEYGAVQICRIEEEKDALIISELKYLPAGENWNVELIKIGRQVITQDKNGILVANQIPDLAKIKIDKSKQEHFMGSLKRGNGFGSDWESELGKLEILSLIGNESAWQILKNYEEFTGEKTDGALAETWKAAISNVEWIKRK